MSRGFGSWLSHVLGKSSLEHDEVSQYGYRSYALEGEDMVLRRLLEVTRPESDFFVDVGAHHPFRFSNTYFFYKKGWRGINIDAMPGSMDMFRKYRPDDINLELAISDTRDTLTYHVFDQSALNTFSEELSAQHQAKGVAKLMQKVDIKTYSLAEVLAKNLPPGKRICFITVDVEDLDLAVLRSNDWEKYRPQYVLMEDRLVGCGSELGGREAVQFMHSVGYQICARTLKTLFFSAI